MMQTQQIDSSRTIWVDAVSAPLARALSRVLGALLNRALGSIVAIIGETERRAKWGSLLDAARSPPDSPCCEAPNQPWLVIQQIDFGKVNAVDTPHITGADATGSRASEWGTGGHPLTYRLNIEDFHAMGIGTPQAGMRTLAFPIVYVGTGHLPSEGDEVFLDSSIWQRYHCLMDPLEKLLGLVEELASYHREGRYQRTVACEYLDFAVRAFRHHRLREIDFGGHAKWLSLHPFQGETRVSLECVQQEQRCAMAPRRLLLVDDYAEKDLVCVGSPQRSSTQDMGTAPGVQSASSTMSLSKQYLIKKSLGDALFEKKDGGRNEDTWVCETATNLEQARAELGLDGRGADKKIYDVIFLDYLLAEVGGKREKGVQLVEEIENADESQANANLGPGGRYWVFPVSAFASAVSADLQRGRIVNISTRCFVAAGADPVCTPHLFRWQLLRFLNTQEEWCRKMIPKVVANDPSAWKYTGVAWSIESRQDAQDLHEHITREHGVMTDMVDAQNKGSLLVKRLLAGGPLEGVSRAMFTRIFVYLEDYLRLLAYHPLEGREHMLQDLEVMRLMSIQENDEGTVSFRDWLKKQRSRLLR